MAKFHRNYSASEYAQQMNREDRPKHCFSKEYRDNYDSIFRKEAAVSKQKQINQSTTAASPDL